MKQEEKELLKDLCARLPYEVKCDIEFDDGKVFHKRILMPIMIQDLKSCESLKAIKPYLFPLSSMTEEQKIECFKGTPLEIDKYGDIAVKDDFYGNSQYTDLEIYLEVIDWCNKNHYDYRGLIPMGLANDATGLNIY